MEPIPGLPVVEIIDMLTFEIRDVPKGSAQ